MHDIWIFRYAAHYIFMHLIVLLVSSQHSLCKEKKEQKPSINFYLNQKCIIRNLSTKTMSHQIDSTIQGKEIRLTHIYNFNARLLIFHNTRILERPLATTYVTRGRPGLRQSNSDDAKSRGELQQDPHVNYFGIFPSMTRTDERDWPSDLGNTYAPLPS